MKENRGLTLVELLVTIAILSVVLLVATSFMTTGSRSFARGSADTQVQKEAELAVNQMEDMIIDVNGGVDLKKDDTTGDRELILYNAGGESGTVDYTKESIIYKAADQKILCSKWKVRYDVASASYVVDSAEYTNQLLAENVTGFEADLSDVYEDTASDGSTIEIVKSVQFKVGYEDGTGKANYATSPIITLRNRMMKSDNPTAIFDDTPVETDTLSLYISDTDMAAAVKIQDGVTEVTRNNLYNIYAMINRGDNVNSLVDWEIEEGNTLSVIDSEGKLTVSEFEPCAYLTITAKYKSNPSKKATGVVKVVGGTLKSLDAVNIITKSLVPFNPKYSSAVTATGFTESDYNELIYKWTVSKPEMVETFDDSGKGLELSIKKESQNYGQTFAITLTVTSPTTGQMVSDSITYRIDSEGTIDGDSNMERGRVGNIEYFHYKVKDWSSNWEQDYYFCDEYGNRLSALEHLKEYITVNHDWAGFGFGIKEGLPADREYYVRVVVNVYPDNGNNWNYDRIFYIPAVEIFGRITNYQKTSAYDSYEMQYAMAGYYGAAWQTTAPYEFEVMDLQYESPNGVVLTPTFSTSYWKDNSANILGTTIGFSSNGSKDGIILKSMKVKVSFKNYPNIYAYSTILFGQSE